MAFAWDVAAFILVFLVIVGLLIRLSMKARRTQEAEATSSESAHEKHLLRFVTDESGKRIGETVAVQGSDFIVKDAKGFLAIPTADVKEEGEGLRLTGAFDEAAARTKGEEWRTRSHKVITYAESELPPDDRTR